MSIILMSDILQHVDLPTTEKFVLLKLADHADHDGHNAYPALGRVAHEVGVSKRTVQRVVSKLTEQEIIKVVGNEGGGSGRPRIYTINIAKAKELCPLAPYGSKKDDTVSSFVGQKDDIGDQKDDICEADGRHQVSPKPFLTVQESRPRESARPRRRPMPADWQPDIETVIWAQQKGFTNEDIGRECEGFADWAIANNHAYADWQAGFRSWLRKAPGFAAQRQRSVECHRPAADGIVGTGARLANHRANGGLHD